MHSVSVIPILHHNTYGLQSLDFKRLTVNKKSKSITCEINSVSFFSINYNTALYPTAINKLTHNIREKKHENKYKQLQSFY